MTKLRENSVACVLKFDEHICAQIGGCWVLRALSLCKENIMDLGGADFLLDAMKTEKN
jgi:hypothetical protein